MKSPLFAIFALGACRCTRATLANAHLPNSRKLSSFQLLADNPACVNHYYSLSWFTVAHLYLIAASIGHDSKSPCTTTYVFDDTFHGKEAISIADAPLEVARYQDDSIPLGDFKLGDIVDAYEHAVAGTGSSALPDFDIVKSNCATFVMNMIGQLGMIVDERIMTYTTRRLATANNGFIAGLVRSSPFLGLLGIDEPANYPDEYLLNRLVHRYVKMYYEGEEKYLDGARSLKEEDGSSPRCGHGNIPFESEEAAAAHHENCAEQDYDVHIGMGRGHICLFAVPSSDDTDGCESVRFHLCDTQYKSIDKRSWDDFAEGSTFSVSTFKFGDLVEAYNDFDPSSDSDFDLVTNNAAPIIVEMLCSLGVVIDNDMLDFVTEQLLLFEDFISEIVTISPNVEKLDTINLSDNDPYVGAGKNPTIIRKLVVHVNETVAQPYCSDNAATVKTETRESAGNSAAGMMGSAQLFVYASAAITGLMVNCI